MTSLKKVNFEPNISQEIDVLSLLSNTSKGKTMRSKFLPYVAAMICIFVFVYSLLSIMNQKDETHQTTEYNLPVLAKESCNQKQAFADVVRVMGELGDIKEICGHIEDNEYVFACNYPYKVLNVYSCASALDTVQDADKYLSQFGSDVTLACIKDRECHTWARTAPTWDFNLILE